MTGKDNDLLHQYQSPNNRSKNKSSLEDSLNQRESRSSLDYQQLFWPSNEDALEKELQDKLTEGQVRSKEPDERSSSIKGNKKQGKGPVNKEFSKFRGAINEPKSIRSPGKMKPSSRGE